MRRGQRIAPRRTIFMIWIVIALVVFVGGPAFAQETSRSIPIDECPDVYHTASGTRCNDPQSFHIEVRNRCDRPIEAQYCIERPNGTWACGMSTLKPGQRTSYYACKSTNRVFRSARIAGSRTKLRQPPERRR
jgi:hypothetical protein